MFKTYPAKASLLAAALIAAMSTTALASENTHSHDGHHVVKLSLNKGKKWQTDEALRHGMGNMRSAVARSLPLIHGGKLDAHGYHGLATKLEGEIAYVVTNCKLDKHADEQLHGVLAALTEGIDALRGQAPEDGAVKVVTALNEYGKYFDHPGWKPLEH